jgi:hypothetical protein
VTDLELFREEADHRRACVMRFAGGVGEVEDRPDGIALALLWDRPPEPSIGD